MEAVEAKTFDVPANRKVLDEPTAKAFKKAWQQVGLGMPLVDLILPHVKPPPYEVKEMEKLKATQSKCVALTAACRDEDQRVQALLLASQIVQMPFVFKVPAYMNTFIVSCGGPKVSIGLPATASPAKEPQSAPAQAPQMIASGKVQADVAAAKREPNN